MVDMIQITMYSQEDNYAQRLSAVYEKTRDPEDFLRCALEYEKLMKCGELSMKDKWEYATIHHFMGRYCKDKAGEIRTDFHDECYCKASCYETMGEIEKAAQMYMHIADMLLEEGYEEEAEMAKREAIRLETQKGLSH